MEKTSWKWRSGGRGTMVIQVGRRRWRAKGIEVEV